MVVLGLGLTCVLFAQTAAKSANSTRTSPKPTRKHAAVKKSGYAYFFDLTGDFEKIDLDTAKEDSQGQIPPAAKIVNPFQTSGVDGCVFCGARYDKRFGRFYVVMAKHVGDSAGGGDNFEIVSIAPPRMYTAKRADVSFAVPNILIHPEGSRVLASYPLNPSAMPSGQLGYGLSIFLAPVLTLLRADKESTTTDAAANGYVFKSSFSDHAYFGEDGSIYDEFSRSSFVNDQLNKVETDPVTLLAKSGGKALAPFALVDLTTKAKTFEVTYIDSASGKAVAGLNASQKGPQALIVLDVKSKSFSMPMKVSQLTVPTTHLTPDGKQILIEESELRHREGAKPDEPQEALFKTGKLILYEAATAKKVREISASKISGFDSQLMCISSDAKIAFFARDRQLAGVNLKTGTTSEVQTQPQFVFDKSTKCVMADR